MSDEKGCSFKDSLNLPKTDFPITNNHRQSDVRLCSFWKQSAIYGDVFCKKLSSATKRFVLHWGPPYANGHMHIGHVLSAVLKDIIVKFKQKNGFAVHFRPGWDCHGLPIENKVAAELGLKKEDIAKQVVSFKAACREYASRWITTQKTEHERLGIIADFENFYATMMPEYEAKIMESFGVLVDEGYIAQRHKTVSWCASCSTVLAVAEIEYKDRKDPSIYLRFRLSEMYAQKLAGSLQLQLSVPVSFLVWTTTPWTLPLNKAIICHPKAEYALVSIDGECLILGNALVPKLAAKFSKNFSILKTFLAADILSGFQVNHPTEAGVEVPVVFEADLVSLNDGTAVVHCAPGCGPEDYLVGIKNKLEIYSPVSEDGRYTTEVKMPELCGLLVTQALGLIISHLQNIGLLYFKESITHSYPHCWRCGEGLIFRATKQWFCDLTHNNLQEQVLGEVANVNFFPAWGKTRFTSFISNRSEWCISRQRFWGVPIVALKCRSCGEGKTSRQLVNFVAQQVKTEGVECWDRLSLADLEKAGLFVQGQSCNKCGDVAWAKETDILDVWFDSGVSHLAVLKAEGEALFPADLYLEGSDQHRGWFNSSLFTSVAINKSACMKAILTHGFVLDQNRNKMSKSKGNVTAPQPLLEQYGADVLRAWVASSDYEGDVVVSPDVFKNCAEVCRKIRNTCRFLLSNLFDIDRKSLLQDNYLVHYNWSTLSLLDRYVLVKLRTVISSVDAAFAKYQFTTALRELNAFCTSDLSAGYLDMVKDTLYVESADHKLRKSTQMTFVVILDFFVHRLAPILSFMAEDLFGHFSESATSVFAVSQPLVSDLEVLLQKSDHMLDSKVFEQAFALLGVIRKVSLEKMERLREAGIIKHPLEAQIRFLVQKGSEQEIVLLKFFKSAEKSEEPESFLKRWLGVSQVMVGEFCSVRSDTASWFSSDAVMPKMHFADPAYATDHGWLMLEATRVTGTKCPRCWQWGQRNDTEVFCFRCHKIVSKVGKTC